MGFREKFFGLPLKDRQAKIYGWDLIQLPSGPLGLVVSTVPCITGSPVTCPCVWLVEGARAHEQGEEAVLG